MAVRGRAAAVDHRLDPSRGEERQHTIRELPRQRDLLLQRPGAQHRPDQPQTLAQFDGAPLLVNFWATWCAPCVEELPRLAEWHARRAADGIAVLAIAQEDDPDTVVAFMRTHALDLPVWIETADAGDHSLRLGNTRSVLPYSVLIGADGVIIEQRIGALDDDDLADWSRLARP